ncbi:MAG: hypothetical protein ACYCST_12230 [Acidimicrobiales bacterium]
MARWKPGPGWARQRDGSYVPHSFTASDFSGAQAVATVFKVAAVLALLVGALAAIHIDQTVQTHRVVILYGIAGGTILIACVLAFFGYVLDLLVALHFDSHHAEASTLAAGGTQEQ